MQFITDIKKEDYIKFVDNNYKAHFLESYGWGGFCLDAKNQIPHYVGMKDDNGNIVATALILEKKMPLGMSYGYSPRGFILDYNNHDLIKKFTSYLKKYMKDNNYVYIKFDPDIKYQDIDSDAKPVEGGFNNYELLDFMKSIGYKHKGFNKLYEGNQPRYTFRINLKKDMADIDSIMNKSFLKSVKRSYDYDLVIDNEINVDDFYRLLQSNSSKDGFNPHSKEYYEAFVKNMDKDMKFFNVSFNPHDLSKKIKEEIKVQMELLKTNPKKAADINNKLTKLNKDYEEFSKMEDKNVVVCSLVCTYTKKYAWSLYIGSDILANQTFAVSRSYYEAIKDAHDRGYEFFDLFGTVGDPNTTYKNLAHLHDFKRKFGDEYIEFIGEFDLVNKPFMYKVLPIALKIYRKIRK